MKIGKFVQLRINFEIKKNRIYALKSSASLRSDSTEDATDRYLVLG